MCLYKMCNFKAIYPYLGQKWKVIVTSQRFIYLFTSKQPTISTKLEHCDNGL